MAKGKSKSNLPQLFSRLTREDWARVKAHADGLQRGDEEAFATSVGYVDVGRTSGGLVYVGAVSGDAQGNDLRYRQAYRMTWPV